MFYIQSLMQINDNLGCCALQIISALVDEGYVLKFYETVNSLQYV